MSATAILADVPGAVVAVIWVGAWLTTVAIVWLSPDRSNAPAPWRLAPTWSAPLRRALRSAAQHRRSARGAGPAATARLAEEATIIDQLLLDAWALGRWADGTAQRIRDGEVSGRSARDRTLEHLRDASRSLEDIAEAIELAAAHAVQESIERSRPPDVVGPTLAELHDRILAHRAAIDELEALERGT